MSPLGTGIPTEQKWERELLPALSTLCSLGLISPFKDLAYLKLTNTNQAYRPRNSKLSKEKLKQAGFNLLPTWQDATDRFCKELEEKR